LAMLFGVSEFMNMSQLLHLWLEFSGQSIHAHFCTICVAFSMRAGLLQGLIWAMVNCRCRKQRVDRKVANKLKKWWQEEGKLTSIYACLRIIVEYIFFLLLCNAWQKECHQLPRSYSKLSRTAHLHASTGHSSIHSFTLAKQAAY
jgi:hypothetical protein